MPRQPKQPKQPVAEHEPNLQLRHPDRSGPSQETLLEIASRHAAQQHLFSKASTRANELARARQHGTADDDDDDDDDDDRGDKSAVLSSRAEHILETGLWTVTLATLHFTFDVLVQNQYGREIDWPSIVARTLRAWGVFLFLFYSLHPFDPKATLLPFLPRHLQHPLRQAIFFAVSVLSGCRLIHITNSYGYLATMKQAPPLGCLWLWAVVELDLVWGCVGLLFAAVFLKVGGYELR
ncbi:hypothetical protein E4U21_001137 [Claviceps maximensis]|nr:hypothetical protein E4U21_001137 [Claviceps maximensis]